MMTRELSDLPPLPLVDGLTDGRCSPTQERCYFARARRPEERNYFPFRIAEDLTIAGKPDRSALKASISALVRRHETLRSALADDGERAYQHVRDPASAGELEIHDLTGVQNADERAAEIAREVRHRPFDLARGNNFHAALISTQTDRHRLVIPVDHVVFDGVSVATLRDDLLVYYAGLCSDPDARLDDILAPLPYQYLSWSDLQWRLLGGDYADRLRDFWSKRLEGAPDLMLPAEASGSRSTIATSVHDTLPIDSLLDVKSLSGADGPEVGASQADVVLSRIIARPLALLSCLFALLHRTTGQTDLCIALPTNARTRQFSGAVGHFVGPLITRVAVAPDLSFRKLFARVRNAFIEAYRWRNVPIYGVVQPPPGLWRVTFNYLVQRTMRWRVQGLEITPTFDHLQERQYADCDVNFFALERVERGELKLTLRTREGLFRDEQDRRFLRELTELTRHLLRCPDQPIGR